MESSKAVAFERATVSPPDARRSERPPMESESHPYASSRSDSVVAARHLLGKTVPTELRHEAIATARAARAPGAGMVRRMLNRSGNSLFTAIEPLPESEFFAAAANGISVAWTVGHLACVLDLFTSWVHGNGPKLPKTVHDVFNNLDVRPAGGPTKAEMVIKSGHSRSDILLLMRTAQIHALKLLDACREDDWNAPPPGPHPDNLHTVGEIWEHLAVHTYWHMGELCGTFPRFHGTYTLNMLPHYFYYLPSGDERG